METRFACNKEPECKRCGGCCHIREKSFLSPKEDLHIKQTTYQNSGVIYLYPVDSFTISLTNQEKEVIEKRAKENDVKINIKPKKIMIINDEPQVLDWFVNHDICPFYNCNEGCTIYPDRPYVCRLFPSKHNVNIFAHIKELDDGKRLDYEEAFVKCLRYAKENNFY